MRRPITPWAASPVMQACSPMQRIRQRLASVMLTGGYGGHQFFSKNTIDEFTKAKSLSYPTWGLGWWRQGEIGRVNYFTTHASGNTIGHQGWHRHPHGD